MDSGQYPSQTPLYGRLCYSSQTLPVLRRSQGPYDPALTELGYRFSGGQPDHSLVIHNQGAVVGPLEPGALYMGPSEVGTSSREGTASQDGATASEEGTPQKNETKDDSGSDAQQSQDLNWVKNLRNLYTLCKQIRLSRISSCTPLTARVVLVSAVSIIAALESLVKREKRSVLSFVFRCSQ